MKKRSPSRVAALLALVAVTFLLSACPDANGPAALKDCTVSFEANGGSAVSSVVVKEGSAVAAPAAPTKAGHAFGGWYADAALSDAWDFAADLVAADMTLYAKWAAVHAIAYVLNSGVNASANPTSYVAGQALTLAAPTRFCRVFDGWYESSDFSGAAVTSIGASASGDKTFYAKWAWADYETRDRGPSGGWIVFSRDDAVAGDPNASDSWKYLEVRSSDLPTLRNWAQAGTDCDGLADTYNATVFDDWRMPNRTELGYMRSELYQYNSNSNIGGFVAVNNADSSYYWSSETYAMTPTQAYMLRIYFTDSPGVNSKYDYSYSVRPVRQF